MYTNLITSTSVLYDAKTQSTGSLQIHISKFEIRNEAYPGIESEQFSNIEIEYDICISGSYQCIDRIHINTTLNDWNDHYSNSITDITGSFNDLINHAAILKVKNQLSNRYGLVNDDWLLV